MGNGITINKIIRELKHEISLVESSQSVEYIKGINLQSKLIEIGNMLANYLKIN